MGLNADLGLRSSFLVTWLFWALATWWRVIIFCFKFLFFVLIALLFFYSLFKCRSYIDESLECGITWFSYFKFLSSSISLSTHSWSWRKWSWVASAVSPLRSLKSACVESMMASAYRSLWSWGSWDLSEVTFVRSISASNVKLSCWWSFSSGFRTVVYSN